MSDIDSVWGKAKTFRVTVTDQNQNQRVDLGGKTLRFTAKAFRSDPDPALVTKTTGTGITHLDQTVAATKGQADILILGSDTIASGKIKAARETELEWDLELIQSGNDFVVDSGKWVISPAVRRTP